MNDIRQSRVGYASGVFDTFHVGHLNLLARAAERCDHLIAGVATDEYAEAVKGRRPLIPFAERVAIVGSLTMVGSVVAEHAEDKEHAWRRHRFDTFFKGDDWRGTPKGDRLEASMARCGVEIVYLPYTRHVSSTLLRALLGEHGASLGAAR